MMSERDVLITGLGLVTCLGEGPEAHWTAIAGGGAEPPLDAARFAPYTIHPLPEIDWGRQIPKRGDQRQMETWQRLGTYAAGMALDDAGFKGDEEACARMDMIVSAAGGERDIEVDASILEAARTRKDHGVLLNEKLTTELRPTLFLAQLSNLLAGNISIVHKVTGASHTFMGEEGSSIAAIQNAAARIRAGQSSHVLVGASFQTEHPDMLLGYELGGFLERDGWRPLWSRDEGKGGGVVTGSAGIFLVLESRAHAEARGRKAYAAIRRIVSEYADRPAGQLRDSLIHMLDELDLPNGPLLAVSGASGAHEATATEKDVLSARAGIALRGISGLFGHVKEAQFPLAVALAALCLSHRTAFAPIEAGAEAAFEGVPERVLATTVGYHRAEGMALLEPA
ncbi:MAG: beta-ketoacyl-ACP synthase [Rhizobiaceae bacterium]